MDTTLTGQVKHRAFTLGADMVGVANIERFADAPLRMSPQGILPQARTVVVCALHHPDGCIELGGREHPQVIGPYNVQYQMNMHLDRISYELARFLEDLGYEAVPIAASNIWRYRRYKDLQAVFAPDISHIYAAVATGLTELGYHGISMSPEFGTRNRFVSIITTAPLDPTTLLPGNTLCDRCNECVKHCRAQALSEEVQGTEDLVIEGHHYTKAVKNLWRCSWGEHFGVDLDLELPAEVTEESIVEAVREHGLRGGEMGSCLRHCLPPHLREWEREYTSAPRRKRPYVPTGVVFPRYVQERMTAAALTAGVDAVVVEDETTLTQVDPTFRQCLPEATRRVGFVVRYPGTEMSPELAAAAHGLALTQAFLAARKLEDLGYRVVTGEYTAVAEASGHWRSVTAHVYTDAPLLPTPATARPEPPPPPVADLTAALRRAAAAWDVDQLGVASPERLSELKAQLAPVLDGEDVLVATNRGKMWLQYEPEVSMEQRRLRDAFDYLDQARAVVVMGLRLPRATVRTTGQPPAEAVGPYIFAQYAVQWALRERALLLVKWLHARGYATAVTTDLMGTGSLVANPRGPQPNVFANRFAALAAGLATLTKGGFVTTRDYGPNIRYIAVVTDAPLAPDALPDLSALRTACDGCQVCLQACPSQAYGDPLTITLEGQGLCFHRLDQKRCDWVARYTLMGGDGFANLGGTTNISPPAEISAEALAEALRQFDTIQGHHRCGVESCVVKCPLATA